MNPICQPRQSSQVGGPELRVNATHVHVHARAAAFLRPVNAFCEIRSHRHILYTLRIALQEAYHAWSQGVSMPKQPTKWCRAQCGNIRETRKYGRLTRGRGGDRFCIRKSLVSDGAKEGRHLVVELSTACPCGSAPMTRSMTPCSSIVEKRLVTAK